MRKLFSLFVALFATISLWSYDFQSGDLYYKFGNAEGVKNLDTIGWNIPAECLTVAQAREICAALENGATTGTKYYVKGWVKKLASKHEEGVTKYNNAEFFIEDVKGANSQEDFEAHQVYGPNGSKITSLDQVLVGDYVVLYGELTNYNGTYETVGKGAAHIWKSTNPALGGNGNTGNNPTELVGNGTYENPYTANDVLLLNNSNAGNYWVKAHIVGQVNGASMSGGAEFNAPFSSSTNQVTGEETGYNTNILIANSADVADVSQCVPVQLPSGAVRTGLNLVQNPDNDGQEVLLYGSLEKYLNVAGVKATQYAKIGDKEFGVNPNIEPKEPTAKVVTIAEFYAAPEATDVYYELTGTISGLSAGGNATIYGNFDLTDETGTVYVYGLTKEFIAVGSTSNDKSFASLGLKDGDKITLRGFRGSYNGKIEVIGAYFVKLISSDNEIPNPDGNDDYTTPEGAIVFDADTENAGIGTDNNNATSYTITKNGVTITVSSGILGTYNGESHYRIYKNQTLTATTTAGNIKSIEFTCIANGDAKYGPGCFTASAGEYGHNGGAVGTWTGEATEVVFTASLNQVRVTQIAVVIENESNNTTKQNIVFNAPKEHYVVVTNQTNDATNYNTLTEVAIPATVEYNGITYVVSGIDNYAFAQAENLQSITILENIKAIGNCAFANCYNLQTITFESEEPPHIFYNTFDNMHYDVQVYVPCGAVSAYQSAGIYNAQEAPAEYNIYLSTEVGGNARIDYNTLCGARISAYPDYGYHFVQWSDGNTDNPRDLKLTQDTILTAEFAQTISGKCGKNLYWSYNESDQSISITGSGEMYNYTSETQPWWLFKEEIKMVTTSNTATSIGEYAFAGAIRLADVYLGSNIETIAENAFAECNRLYHIYCYPTYPPFAKQSSFANYNIYLHVPCAYKEDYDLDVVFGNFKYIECIGAETDNTSTDTVIINASSTHVTITWPTEENANTYTIVIKNGDIVFCTLTFNANGQLLNIAFAPAKNGSNHTAQYATQTTNGLRFTVTGLNESTHYTYDITAKNNEGDTIQTHTGAFTTKSNASTEVDNINTQTSAIQKLFHDNQLLILRDGKTYNVMGQEL